MILVYGVGINDSSTPVDTTVKGVRVKCPFYKRWSAMLERCYSPRLHKTNPTYVGCSVCDEWIVFSNFRKWMKSQDWMGMELDKDLLVDGNKVYSPKACCFVDLATNRLLNKSAASRGKFPIGVYFQESDGLYVAQCCDGHEQKYLGGYSTPEAAHKVYLKYKSGVILRAAEKQTDSRVKAALIARAKAMLSNQGAGNE